MKIKFYKNPERIGGGITELFYAGHRLIIDMGADLPDEDKQGKEEEEQNPRIEGLTKGKANCDGVLISHYHGDHIGLDLSLFPTKVLIGLSSGKILKENIFGAIREFRLMTIWLWILKWQPSKE